MMVHVKTSRYFQEQGLRKWPYLQLRWCEFVITNPMRKEVQSDGRIRYWGVIAEVDRILRVVVLEDGETIHNAFFDRTFRPDDQ
ncbi:MAG TPA: hypothetical protein V6D08_05705 [Candidatus Obscuribacterales bacterium]